MKVVSFMFIILFLLSPAGLKAQNDAQQEQSEQQAPYDPPEDELAPVLNTPASGSGITALRIGSGIGMAGAAVLMVSGIFMLIGEIDETEQNFLKGALIINAGVLTLGLSGILFSISLENPEKKP